MLQSYQLVVKYVQITQNISAYLLNENISVA